MLKKILLLISLFPVFSVLAVVDWNIYRIGDCFDISESFFAQLEATVKEGNIKELDSIPRDAYRFFNPDLNYTIDRDCRRPLFLVALLEVEDIDFIKHFLNTRSINLCLQFEINREPTTYIDELIKERDNIKNFDEKLKLLRERGLVPCEKIKSEIAKITGDRGASLRQQLGISINTSSPSSSTSSSPADSPRAGSTSSGDTTASDSSRSSSPTNDSGTKTDGDNTQTVSSQGNSKFKIGSAIAFTLAVLYVGYKLLFNVIFIHLFIITLPFLKILELKLAKSESTSQKFYFFLK